MKSVRVVTVFGSSQLEENYPDYQKAVLIGRMLAEAGFAVCNGGYGGIMEASARGAKEAGGETIGIITEEFPLKANRWIDKVKTMKTWRERLFELIETGDAYLLFDGGTGTLVELFVVWEMMNKKMMQKPVVVFGPFLRALLRELRKERFVIFNDWVRPAETVDQALESLRRGLGKH
jgi:hypothetical protein